MTNGEKVYIFIMLAVIVGILAIFSVISLDMLGNIEETNQEMLEEIYRATATDFSEIGPG